MTRALGVEVHVDKVLEELLGVLGERFVKGANAGKTIDMAEWIAYCEASNALASEDFLTLHSHLGLYG